MKSLPLSPRAARLFLLALALFILASAPGARYLLDWLRGGLGAGGLKILVGGLFLLAGAGFARLVRIWTLPAPNILALAALLLAGGAGSLALAIPEERVHLAEFAALSFLAAAAGPRTKGWPLAALLFTALFGGLDELFQWLLPNRVGDLRDVLFNALGGLWGVLLYLAATARLRASSASAGAGALLLSCFPATASGGDLELLFLDVGYGDAILLTNPSGAHILIDTGYPEAREAVAGELARRGVKALDWLIVTHPHADHLGNAVWALREFHPARWGDNGQAIDRFSRSLTEEMAREYEREFRGGKGYARLKAGDAIAWGEVSLRVLWPDAPAAEDWNTNSLALRVTSGGFSALLSGDINLPAESALIAREKGNLAGGLLKAGHHGAADASSADWLRAVSPRWAIVSVGANEWGNPAPETLQRLAAAGGLVLRTDREGMILVRYSPPETVHIFSRRFGPLITSVRDTNGGAPAERSGPADAR